MTRANLCTAARAHSRSGKGSKTVARTAGNGGSVGRHPSRPPRGKTMLNGHIHVETPDAAKALNGHPPKPKNEHVLNSQMNAAKHHSPEVREVILPGGTPSTAKLVDDTPFSSTIRVCTNHMAPRYEQGDVAFIVPCSTVSRGRDYMLTRMAGNLRVYRMVRVDRVTKTHFIARQYNPAKVERFSRRTWAPAYKVTGRYNCDPLPGYED